MSNGNDDLDSIIDEMKQEFTDEQSSPSERLTRLREAGLLTDAEFQTLHTTDIEKGESPSNDEAEFGAVPVSEQVDGFEISILGVFPQVDVSPVVYNHQLDEGEQPSRTVVLWEVFNETDSSESWGNSAINYVLQNRLKVNPDDEYLPDTHNLKGPWEIAPQSGVIGDIESNVRARWISLVDVPDGQQIAEATIEGYSHPRITIAIPDSAIGQESKLPFK